MSSEHQAISQHQVEQEETTIDLAELFYRLLDKAKLPFIIAALLGAIIAFCVTKFFMTPMYQASAKLYVLNSSGTSLNLSQDSAEQFAGVGLCAGVRQLACA